MTGCRWRALAFEMQDDHAPRLLPICYRGPVCLTQPLVTIDP
jgi:hypothetical protein